MQDIPKEVLIKAQEGDAGSFEAIYKETAGFVYNVAFRMLNRKHDAEEVTQEVFLNIYHNLKKFRFQSSFRTWAYRITVNSAINHLRRMKKEEKGREEYNENLDYVGNLAMSSDSSHNKAQEEVVNSLLSFLNPDQKACVVLRNMEGLSYQEIADTLKININTVRTRLKRAREKLLALRKGITLNEL